MTGFEDFNELSESDPSRARTCTGHMRDKCAYSANTIFIKYNHKKERINSKFYMGVLEYMVR